MSFTTSHANEQLEHLLNNEPIPNVGDAPGLPASATDGDLYLALFTADPGEAGAVTNEADYTGYARKEVARDPLSKEWTVANSVGTNANEIAFDPCTGGSNVITHAALCKAGTSGVQDILISGALTTSRTVSNGATPRYPAGNIDFTLQ